MQKPNHSQMPPYAAIMDMMGGAMIAQSIYVAAKIGVADLMKDGGKTADELATQTKTHGPTLYRLLRALASVGLFTENENKRFTLTDRGETLQTNHPMSTRAAAIMFGEPWHTKAWGDILFSVQTGKPAFDHAHGTPLFEFFGKHPEANQIFNDAMTNFTNMEAAEIAAAYDFGKAKRMVDVAGGVGGFLITALKAYPTLSGVLFDLPSVTEPAKKKIGQAGLQSRCEVATGDFFKSVPAGADLYFMKSIIHDWSDDRALTILKNCHTAMEKNGKLVLAERVIPPGNEPFFGKFLDLEMLVMTQGGKERTEAEYRVLFETAGFKLTKIIPTRTPLSVIEGTRVS